MSTIFSTASWHSFIVSVRYFFVGGYEPKAVKHQWQWTDCQNHFLTACDRWQIFALFLAMHVSSPKWSSVHLHSVTDRAVYKHGHEIHSRSLSGSLPCWHLFALCGQEICQRDFDHRQRNFICRGNETEKQDGFLSEICAPGRSDSTLKFDLLKDCLQTQFSCYLLLDYSTL